MCVEYYLQWRSAGRVIVSSITPKAIDYYITQTGVAPFLNWFDDLSIPAQARIRNRINRVAVGNTGKAKSVGDGVHELKFKDKGFPAFRVYFGNDGDALVILLSGGDKSNQNKDILSAKEYWHDYKENK